MSKVEEILGSCYLMFSVIYRATISEKNVEPFQSAWLAVAQYFVESCGAVESTLYKTEDGGWLAHSTWSSREAWELHWRDDSGDFPRPVVQAIAILKASIVEEKPVITMVPVQKVGNRQ